MFENKVEKYGAAMNKAIQKYRKFYPYVDLYQVALIGLNAGLSTFDPTKGKKESSHVISYIGYEFSHFIQQQTNYGNIKSELNVELNDNIGFYDDTKTMERRWQLEKLNKYLNERERKIIYRHYYRDQNLSEIGKIMNISGERIRQIRNTGLEKLRSVLNDK